SDDDAFPTYQLTILAICRFSEPIAFNSILAYTYVMVQDLNGNDINASFYAGLLVSAYAVAEALTAMMWGAISDRYGRKPVVLFGLCGVALSSLLFGLAKKYWVALLARFVGGSLNGNVSVMQTMVAEMVMDKPQHEPRAYAVQPFVWFLGSIIGSAMGGFLAQPAKFYPDIFPEDGLFGQYPYLLPNLVAVAVIVAAVIQGIFFLDETNPRFKNKKTRKTIRNTTIAQKHHRSSSGTGLPTATDQRFDLRRNSFGTIHSISVRPDLRDPSQDARGQQDQRSAHNHHHDDKTTQRAFNFSVIMLIITLVIAAFHQMAFGAILPIYLLDAPSYSAVGPHPRLDLVGGMGFSLHDVGGYLAVNGFIALFCQGVIFPVFVEKAGVWLSFLLPTLLYPICYIIMPFLSLLRPSRVDDGVNTTTAAAPDESWLLPAGIYASMFLQNLLGIIATPCALILLKNATPSPLVLGRVNGLAMSAVCAARTVSSPLVGVVYDFGGSAAAWGSCAAVAVLGAVQLWWVPREGNMAGTREAEVHVENVLVGH
ncbi:MFS general substrate transporter, partial [Cryphonectria parasitica EP155]